MNTIFICIMSMVASLACSSGSFFRARQSEKINERWEGKTAVFKIRITAYAEENGGYAPGAYYVFQSAQVGSDNWKEIVTIRHDDPVAIPQQQVRFINDRIGYGFMVYKYMVTTDGGESWNVWDIVNDMPDWRNTRAVIKEVQVASDGTGTMSLESFTIQRIVPDLHTKDFGRHWSIES